MPPLVYFLGFLFQVRMRSLRQRQVLVLSEYGKSGAAVFAGEVVERFFRRQPFAARGAGGSQVFLCGQGGRRRICSCFCWQRFRFRLCCRCWRWRCQGYDLNSRRQVRCRCGFRFCVTFVGRRFIGLGAGCLQAAKVADHVVDRAGEARYVGQVFEGISPHLYLGQNLFALGNYDSELVVLFFHGCCPFWFVGVTSFLALLRR